MTDPIGVPAASSTALVPYCTSDDIPNGRLVDSNGKPLQDVDVDFAIAASTELLFHLSGRKYRTGRSIIRPTQIGGSGAQAFLYPLNAMAGYGTSWGFGSGWAWSSMGPAWWASRDGSEITLVGPVTKINEVMVDGQVLAPTAYAVYGRRRLVRLGAARWPLDQDLQADISSPNTCRIDYEWGAGPGEGGKLACAALAVDLALALSGQDAHRLPARVLSIATQGTNVAVGDALEFLREDLTGIPAVDIWLRAVNPQKRRRRAFFGSPSSVIGRST